MAQELQILGGSALELKSAIHVGLGCGKQCTTLFLVSLNDRHPRGHRGTDLVKALRSHWDAIRIKLPDCGSSGSKPASMINDGGRDYELGIGQDGVRRASENGWNKGLLGGMMRDVKILRGVGKRARRKVGKGTR